MQRIHGAQRNFGALSEGGESVNWSVQPEGGATKFVRSISTDQAGTTTTSEDHGPAAQQRRLVINHYCDADVVK